MSLFQSRNLSVQDINDIMDRGADAILIVFDGYDETSYRAMDRNNIVGTEMEAIIRREARKKFNLIVTSRPWRHQELLSVDRYGFEKMSIVRNQLSKKERNDFIKSFFLHMNEDISGSLIDALDSPRNIVPEAIQNIKRMLKYICHIWQTYNLRNEADEFFNMEKVTNDLWELMRLTYNSKYPNDPKGVEDLQKLREVISEIDAKELTLDEIYEAFGDEKGFDVFYFGIYSTALKYFGSFQNLDKIKTIVRLTPGLEFLPHHERDQKFEMKRQQEDAKNDFNFVMKISLFIIIIIILFISLQFLIKFKSREQIKVKKKVESTVIDRKIESLHSGMGSVEEMRRKLTSPTGK